MNRDLARQWMMNRLYEKLHPDQQTALDEVLQNDAELRQEWEQVQATHFLYESLHPVHPSDETTELIQKQARTDRRGWFGSLTWTRAAAILVTLCLGGYIGYEIDDHKSELAPLMEARIIPTIEPVPYAPVVASALHPAPVTEAPSSVDQAVESSSHLVSKTQKSQVDEAKAEELFRIGLANYNLAFTKVGEERETLLKSAIISLRDVREEFPGALDWVAFSLMLIADAHRELNNIDDAIEAYQVVLAECSNRDTLCQKARLSSLQLMIHDETRREQAVRLAESLVVENGLTDETATTLLTLAEQMKTERPHQVLRWMDAIIGQWAESHTFHRKARQIRFIAQAHWLKLVAIRDWIRSPNVPISTTYMQAILRDGQHGLGDAEHRVSLHPVPWEPITLENGTTNFSAMQNQQAVFYRTYVYSPVKQSLMLVSCNPEYNEVFLNDESLWRVSWNPTSYKNETGVRQFMRDWNTHLDGTRLFARPISLKQGWNHIAVRSLVENAEFHDQYEFSLAILLNDGRVPETLHIGAAEHPDQLISPETFTRTTMANQSNPSTRMEVNP